MSGVPAELMSALRFELVLLLNSQLNLKFTVRARIPNMQPPPPRLPADQALALDLLKLYREQTPERQPELMIESAFQHVLSLVITVVYADVAV